MKLSLKQRQRERHLQRQWEEMTFLKEGHFWIGIKQDNQRSETLIKEQTDK